MAKVRNMKSLGVFIYFLKLLDKYKSKNLILEKFMGGHGPPDD